MPLVGGLLVGLSLPPIGVWPMAIVGVACLAFELRDEHLRSRLLTGMLFGGAQFLVSLAWAIKFNIAGYIALSLVEACFIALACCLVPPRRGRLPGLAGALTLAEWARQSWPFGGLPLGSLALGQATGPIAGTARVGGVLLVVGTTVLAGAALGACVPFGWPRGSPKLSTGNLPKPFSAALGAVLVIGLVITGAFAPNGASGTPPASASSAHYLHVAIVQGGGRRGLDQLQVPSSVVLSAAIKETALIPAGINLIVWPEDVVALQQPLVGSPTETVLSNIARSHHATFVAGVTWPVGATQFRNEVVAFSPSGTLVAQFEKVHRVPFGEYVPYRSFFEHLANLKDIPRDAIAGTGSGMISTPAGRFAVLISYEVFFANRGRSGVRHGGEVILVPTNTSSYSDDQAPSQEIAASQFQAIEEGRYVVQAAPTGYSAEIDNDGTVLKRSSLSAPAIITAQVPLLSGQTWYERFGDQPVIGAALAALLLAWLGTVSTKRKRPGSASA